MAIGVPAGAADLTVGPLALPSFPDDLAAGPDGALVTTTAGQLMRVDPATNHACTILAGQAMTAVAVMPESGRGLAVTTVLGDVLRVRLPG